MRVLLTNDDGILAPGLEAIFHQLKKIADVTVVAPDGQRSSISHAITLARPLRHQEVSFCGRFRAHTLDGTPADCVKFALAKVMPRRPDLVISGINNGSNDGCSVFYSGTIGAAREGALSGIPSMALSLDVSKYGNFLIAAEISVKLIRRIRAEGLSQGTFLNINIPDVRTKGQIRGIRWAEQCPAPIHSIFQEKKDPAGSRYYWLTGRPPVGKDHCRSDMYLLQKGYVVMTPVLCDVTDRCFLEKVVNQNFDNIL